MDAQKQIKKLMEERSWTDYRLAKESGLSHSTVTNMFDRNNTPTLPTLEAVCRAFGITLAQFFRGKPTGTDRGTAGFVCEMEFSGRQKNPLPELMDTMQNPADSTERIYGVFVCFIPLFRCHSEI